MKVFDITKNTKIWFSIPALIIGFAIIFVLFTGGLNYGIDFTGGSTINATIGKDFKIEDVRTIISKYDKNATITSAGNDNESVLIKTTAEIDDVARTSILKEFESSFGVTPSNVQFETIGATIGDEMQRKAVLAIMLAVIGILIYITFRFEVKFGVAAILALLHDILIIISAFAILKIQINSTFIAALLTIVGYSINNTIVVFDRIRENMKFTKKSNLKLIVNESISQTLTRSMNTTITTLLTIVSLYVLGVPAVKEFALPLIIGIVAGTYSSVLLAGPIWIKLHAIKKS